MTTSSLSLTGRQGCAFAHPAHFLAFGFGAGLARRAPGTFGTLVAFPLYKGSPVRRLLGLGAVFLLVGSGPASVAGRAFGEHDHGGIVWDEIAAFLMVLPFAPPTWWGYGCWPSRCSACSISGSRFPSPGSMRACHGGFGVMLDDVLAAGYAMVCPVGA
jgi:phosphatidylglycerophosphatase A